MEPENDGFSIDTSSKMTWGPDRKESKRSENKSTWCKKKQPKHAKTLRMTFLEILVGWWLNAIVNWLDGIIPYINSKASLFVTYIRSLDLNPVFWGREIVLRIWQNGCDQNFLVLLPSKWMFPKIGVPQNGWFIMENPIKMNDLEENPLFSETSI